MEQLAEQRVAGHAELAHAHDVGGRQIDDLAVGAGEVLQELRVVVQLERAGIQRAERVDQVLDRTSPAAARCRVRSVTWSKRALLDQAVVRGAAEAVVVADQRVHAVDGDELFGERVGRRMVVVG